MVDYQVGDTATISKQADAVLASDSWVTKRFNSGTSGMITRVSKNIVTLRLPYKGQWDTKERLYSFNVSRDALERPNNEEWQAPPPKPKRRAIGEVPEGGISPDDPGLAWLWEDAERVANSSNYCYQYDHMANKLGIPGRLRDIAVTLKVNGLEVTSTVKARSTKEAEAKVREKLGLP